MAEVRPRMKQFSNIPLNTDISRDLISDYHWSFRNVQKNNSRYSNETREYFILYYTTHLNTT